MYAPAARGWSTPNGRPVVIHYREDTNDWNTVSSILDHDEYGLRGRQWHGLALDIGSYLGIVALALALDDPDLHVIAVEPVPDNLRLIALNLAANGVTDRVTVIDGAAGRHGETLTARFGFRGSELATHHAFVGNISIAPPEAPHETREVRAHSIRDLVGDAEVSFCKIDCEGGEWDFLADPAVSQLAEIVGEWHPSPRPDGTAGRRGLLMELLAPTHDLTFAGPEAGPEGFTALRRQ